ncbi:MAG: NAD+ synthase [Bacteroidota bacterium]
MKISIAQLNYHIGNFEGNLNKMLEAVDQTKAEGSDIIVFGELSVCGYPPRDFLEFDDFIGRSQGVVEALTSAANDIAIVVGAPSPNPVIEGKDLFNSCYFLADGEVLHIAHKALLPTYDIFDEYRYFEPASNFKVVEYKGKRIALTICEDIWNVGNENPLYTVSPLDELIGQDPDFVINISASPFSYSQATSRIHVLKANVDRYGLPMFYCNHVGAQTEIIFDGGSLVMSPNGKVYDEMPYFIEAIKTYELDNVVSGTQEFERPKEKMSLIHDAIVLGVKDYFGKLGFKSAILGLSGGLDSALTCALAVRALGKEHVRGVLMPSKFSSDHSVNDARQLAENLGIQYDIISIESAYEAFIETMGPYFKGLPFDVTEENLQARIRGNILMAMSNKFGYILLNTSNKSEAAVGYGTLYGDMAGGLSVIGDVYKTEAFELARYVNKDGEVIPENTITKPPSAELRPNQKDSDSLPPYEQLDEVLYHYIEERLGPNEIIDLGFDEALVKRTLRLVNINEFKRYQTAPMLRVSTKAFGMGRRMPIVGKYLS